MRLTDSSEIGPPVDVDTMAGLRRRVAQLTERLREAEETLDAIRAGEVDAVVVGGDGSANGPSPRVYTLETADQPYRLLIEEIQEGALTLGADGVILYCNQALATILRTPLERVIGARLRDFLPEGQQEAVAQLMALGRGRIDFVLRAGSGAAVPAHLSLSELSVEDGHHLRRVLCGVLVDLTEREAQAHELAEAYAHLTRATAERQRAEVELHQSRKMEALGRLASGIAHDFNNVLQLVQGSIALVSKRMRHDAEGAQRFLDLALDSVERGAAVTGRLLAFARRSELSAARVETQPLLERIAQMLKHTLGPAVVLRAEVAPDTPALLADGRQFEAVLVNLASNAFDALPQGVGSITLAAAAAKAPASLPAGDYVRITVTDDGQGMTPEVLERITEPFFTTKPKGKGTGLGLAMARGFAEQSGGALVIESAANRGTTVALWLPRAVNDEESVAATETDDGPTAAVGPRGSLLVVDDEPGVRATLAAALVEYGHTVTEAGDGSSALARLDEGFRPHALVTDLSMLSGMDGLALAREVRRRCPGLPVVLITGHVGDAHRAALEEAAGDGPFVVLRKPFSAEALEAQVAIILEAGRRLGR